MSSAPSFREEAWKAHLHTEAFLAAHRGIRRCPDSLCNSQLFGPTCIPPYQNCMLSCCNTHRLFACSTRGPAAFRYISGTVAFGATAAHPRQGCSDLRFALLTNQLPEATQDLVYASIFRPRWSNRAEYTAFDRAGAKSRVRELNLVVITKQTNTRPLCTYLCAYINLCPTSDLVSKLADRLSVSKLGFLPVKLPGTATE